VSHSPGYLAVARYRLDNPPFAGRTGRGVRIAVIDSGIHGAHPHVGGVAGGLSLLGGDEADFVDRIGHGTAVAAAIREKSPDAELLAIRVFDRQLATTADVLARAIVWAADHDARIINLSLGTTNTLHAERLGDAVRHASARGALVVSPRESDGVPTLPGALPDVAGVTVDWQLERDEIEFVENDGGWRSYRASGYPRPIPGVPKERNLYGVSFAVANVSGFLARTMENRE
jgi:subtilisin family serine protease